MLKNTEEKITYLRVSISVGDNLGFPLLEGLLRVKWLTFNLSALMFVGTVGTFFLIPLIASAL